MLYDSILVYCLPSERLEWAEVAIKSPWLAIVLVPVAATFAVVLVVLVAYGSIQTCLVVADRFLPGVPTKTRGVYPLPPSF